MTYQDTPLPLNERNTVINPFTTTTPPIVEAFERIRTEAPTRSKAAMILAEAGGHIVLANPVGAEEDQKKPWDVRTTAEKSHDEATYGPDRGKGGAWSATSDPDRLRLVFDRATSRNDGTQPNIGLNVGMSGLIAVDADQAEDVSEVQAAACPEDPLSYVPTTWTPGVVTQDGKVRHKGGAHFLFYDDIGVELPVGGAKFGANTDVFTHEGRYVMVPPSERNGRPYTVAGPIRPLSSSPWLVQFLSQKAEDARVATEARAARAEASQSVLGGGADAPGSIDAWNDGVSWDELLDKAGWERQPDVDTCGCPVWYIPDHGNRRSATAHEPGCSHESVTITGDSGPLHVWTSDLPEELEKWESMHPRTGQFMRVSKAQFSAAMWHDSDMKAFLAAEGLAASAYEPWDLDTARVASTTPALTATEEDEFWNSREWLAKIREAALGRMTPPWAVLGAVLAHVAYTIPPYVMIPPILGHSSPVNLFVGLVGASGAGKGSSTGLARELLVGLPDIHRGSVGSGEGLVRLFGVRPTGTAAETMRGTYRRSSSAMLDVPEVSTLFSQANRNGNTITSMLLSGWTGESLMLTYADPTKTFHIPENSYRMASVLGIQPRAFEGLGDMRDVGLPQRFLLLTTEMTDEELDHPPILGDLPVDLHVDVSHIQRTFPDKDRFGYHCLDDYLNPFGAPETDEDDDETPTADESGGGEDVYKKRYPRYEAIPDQDRHVVTFCDTAITELREAAKAAKRRTLEDVLAPEEDLKAHIMLIKARVAVVLSVMGGGNGDVTEDVWALAGTIHRKHLTTLDRLFSLSRAAAKNETVARGKAQGVQNMAAAEVVEAKAHAEVEKVRNTVLSVLKADGGWVSNATLRQPVTSPQRKKVAAVLDDLVEDGTVETMEGEKASNGRVPVLYRLTQN